MANLPELAPEQRVTVRELRKELRGEKPIGTTPGEASMLLLAIAEEIQALHGAIQIIRTERTELACGIPIPHYGPL